MKVTLINYTPDALETLIFTKNTRLRMTAKGLDEIKAWPMEKKLIELEYMRNTIQSSWEFVNYMFMIEGVTRGFTHQLVRHRAGTSFAQQTQRTVDMTGFTYETGESIAYNPAAEKIYDEAMEDINGHYQDLLLHGVNPQDARGVLPTNIHTNICFGANLRTLADMGEKRLCVKAQGEFQNVFRAIREEVLKVHPWTEGFIRVHCAKKGICCFPTFPANQCPVKPYVYDPLTGSSYSGHKALPLDEIQKHWLTHRAEAQPIVPQEE